MTLRIHAMIVAILIFILLFASSFATSHRGFHRFCFPSFENSLLKCYRVIGHKNHYFQSDVQEKSFRLYCNGKLNTNRGQRNTRSRSSNINIKNNNSELNATRSQTHNLRKTSNDATLPIFNLVDLIMPDEIKDEEFEMDSFDANINNKISNILHENYRQPAQSKTANTSSIQQNKVISPQNFKAEERAKEALNAFRTLCARTDRQEGMPPPRSAAEMSLEVAAQCGRWDVGMEILELMLSHGLSPRVTTYKPLLRSWKGDIKEQVQFVMVIIGAMAAAKIAPDLELLEMSTVMCSKAGGMKEALYLLGQANVLNYVPSETMYGACVRALCSEGRWQRALHLIREGESALGFALNADIRTVVIRAAKLAGQWRVAVSILEEMEEGVDKGWRRESWPNAQTYSAAITACAQRGEWKRGIEVLDSMLSKQYHMPPNIYVFNAAISGCERAKQWREALDLLQRAENMKLKPDVITYNTVISACAKGGQWKIALELLEAMKSTVQPDIISYNSAISACATASGDDAKAFERAMSLMDEMRRKGIQPDKFSYSAAMKACTRSKNSKRALQLLNQMQITGVTVDVVAYTSAMDACAATGQWQECINLLDEMRAKDIAANDRTYRAAIAACGKGGEWQRALDLLSSMRLKGFVILRPTYNSAIAACEKGGQHAHALSLMKQMSASGISPDIFTYGSAINACSSGGHWHEALSLLDEMRRFGPELKPNLICYTAAICAAGRGGNAQLALDLLSQIKSDGLQPDTVAYNAVINACRRNSLYNEAIFVLNDMSSIGLTPDLATITDMISALEEGGLQNQADAVFNEAVRFGILPSSSLDSEWEVDVSDLPPTIAKLKMRSMLKFRKSSFLSGTTEVRDLTFVCGTGLQRSHKSGLPKRKFDLRSYLIASLGKDYVPPLSAYTQPTQQGCIVIPAVKLRVWIESQNTSQ